jgi:formylmethanofuran dehydrogenase subunit C
VSVLTLTARAAAAGVGGEAIAPDRLGSLGEREVARTPLRVGRRWVELGELFAVRLGPRGEAKVDASPELRVETGGLRLDGLGAGMSAGRLGVEGDAGDRLGAGMRGGEIRLEGSCGDWAGAEMSGGVLRVSGSAGQRLGGALSGSPRGMTGGVILVGGAAGDEAGAAMRRGLVAVGGDAGARAGFHAIAGTVLVFGDAGPAPALATKRGSLVVFGSATLLPSFRYACDFEPAFMRLYLRHLAGPLAFAVPERFLGGRYRRFAGDFSQLGKGEILLWRET